MSWKCRACLCYYDSVKKLQEIAAIIEVAAFLMPESEMIIYEHCATNSRLGKSK